MKANELTEKIIGCAYTVHKTLGEGFVEKVYENALRIEMEKAGLRVEQQTPIEVRYSGHIVGQYCADLRAESCLIIEVKAVRNLLKEHEVQLVNYLAATQTETGLLLNFGPSVQVKRKFRTYVPPGHREAIQGREEGDAAIRGQTRAV